MQDFRIRDLGRSRFIDSGSELGFRFDGKSYGGFRGDSLSSALLANGVFVVGRSFKYHRRRGFMSADESEANGLLTILHSDGGREPNCSAPSILLEDGLECLSQNCFPSLGFDVLALNGLLSRFMPAGFYYKTFMGPFRRSWMWFEPMIRRAAGLGRANYVADSTVYDHYSWHADVAVIGSGIAGLCAAYAAGASGARVLLLEQRAHLGGSLLSESVGSASDGWLSSMLERLRSMENVRIVNSATVFGFYDHNILGALESRKHESKEKHSVRLWKIYAGSVILASGALERSMGFGNNDLPNIMLSSGLRRYVNGYGVLPGREVVIFANDDSGYATAFDLVGVSSDISVTIVDVRSRDAIPSHLRDRVEELRLNFYPGHVVVGARGKRRVEQCRLAAYDHERDIIGRSYKSVDCDLLAVAGGFTPTLHLHSQRGEKPIYDSDIYGFVPRARAESGHFCVGACSGVYNASDIIKQALSAGESASRHVGYGVEKVACPTWEEESLSCPSKPLFFVESLSGDKCGKIFLDLQNDVTLDDVRLAHREGYDSVEHMKRYTTLGMATDQGKTSNMAGFHILAMLRGKPVEELGTTTFRPPYVGVPIGALAGRESGSHFRPLRRIPLHDWHLGRGARMINTVSWQRPWYYRADANSSDKNNSDKDEVVSAYIREMTHVRKKVGLVDVSTLGKIVVAGPDAAEFLNRVYINGFKSLAMGRCRYGVMLRDDGFVLDDGTVTRIGEHEYFMTTTTVEAEVVYRRLEFLLDSQWSDLKVHVLSVSDEWCGLALAGPDSREVLSRLVSDDVSDESLPYMGYKESVLRDSDVSVRLLRISFSGELGYELYVRRGEAETLAEACMAAGSEYDLCLYGLEAMGALRIEKGFLTSAEIDGRHNLEDLALERLASTKKPYLGSVLRHREAFKNADRPRLVGLVAEDSGTRFRNGSLIYEQSGDMKGHGLGHVSSVTWSPNLRRYIALGFIAGGMARKGEIVRVSYPLTGDVAPARVSGTDFLAETPNLGISSMSASTDSSTNSGDSGDAPSSPEIDPLDDSQISEKPQ